MPDLVQNALKSWVRSTTKDPESKVFRDIFLKKKLNIFREIFLKKLKQCFFGDFSIYFPQITKTLRYFEKLLSIKWLRVIFKYFFMYF